MNDAEGEESRRRPVVAAFDFDGTLTRGGSTFPFLVSVRGWLPVIAATLRTLPQMLVAVAVGGEAADRGKESLFTRVLAGLEARAVDRAGAAFAERHLRRRLRPEMRGRVAWHRSQGHRVLVVSASPECYVGPAGALLGVDGVLATRLADDGGVLTGRFEGRNCRGEQKVVVLASWLAANEVAADQGARPLLWAYGNGRGDLRLLRAADYGVDAGRLGRLGRLRGFPRFRSVARDAQAPPRSAHRRAGDAPVP